MTDRAFRLCCWLFPMILSCSSVEIEHYSLDGWKDEAPPAVETVAEDVGVQNFTSPVPLRRHEIVVREGDRHRLSMSARRLWWALPEEMATESFRKYLASRKVFRHVLPYPTAHDVGYLLEGNLETFEFQIYPEEWQTRIGLEIYLTDTQEGRIAWTSGLLTSSRSCPPNFEDAVQEMRATLIEIFERVCPQIQRAAEEDSLRARED